MVGDGRDEVEGRKDYLIEGVLEEGIEVEWSYGAGLPVM